MDGGARWTMATKVGTFKMKVWGEHCQQREMMSLEEVGSWTGSKQRLGRQEPGSSHCPSVS